MLLPKRVKYRRVQRGRMTGKATRGNTITYGEFGLQATEPSVAVRSGSRFSLISPLPSSLPRPVWVPVRALRSIG